MVLVSLNLGEQFLGWLGIDLRRLKYFAIGCVFDWVVSLL